jgi:hypothetical protein
VAEGEKSLDQLMHLAMSVYYNWDITLKKKKKTRNTMIHCRSQRGPNLTGACILSLLPLWTGGALPQRMHKRGTTRETARPLPEPCPLCKGNHWRSKCPISRWKVWCHLLWIDGSWALLCRLHLTSMLKSLG